MMSLRFNALLAVTDLFGILVATWIDNLRELVYLNLVIMLDILLLDMTRGFSIKDALDLQRKCLRPTLNDMVKQGRKGRRKEDARRC